MLFCLFVCLFFFLTEIHCLIKSNICQTCSHADFSRTQFSPRSREISSRFSAGFWPPRFLDLGEISAAKILPRFLILGSQNLAENLAEIPKSRRPKSCRESPAENISQGSHCFLSKKHPSDEC